MRLEYIEENIGEIIKKLRKKKKLTQIELGRKVGVSGTTIGKYERGEKIPNPKMKYKLYLALNYVDNNNNNNISLCQSRKWKQWQKDYVFENWGVQSIQTIAKYIDKTERAVQLFAVRNRLGGAVASGNYLNILDISNILGLSKNVIRERFIKKEGLPCKKRNLTINQQTYIVDIDNFIEWLKNNQDKWSSKNMEINILGYEPTWLKLKRKKDMASRKGEPWTEWEERRCFHLMKLGYSNEYIADDLNRPLSNIKRKRTIFNKSKTDKKSGQAENKSTLREINL